MNEESPVENLIAKIAANVRGFGIRILVHISGLIMGGVADYTLTKFLNTGKSSQLALDLNLNLNIAGHTLQGMISRGGNGDRIGTGALALCVYVGVICLVPRGMKKSSYWLFPVLTGLLQCFFWLLIGMPWQLTIFWGGIQTFLQRALIKKGSLGTEWVALFGILIGLVCWFATVPDRITTVVPLWTMPIFFALGGIAHYLYVRFRLAPGRHSRFMLAVRSFERYSSNVGLPSPMQKPLLFMGEQSNRYLNAKLCSSERCELFIDDLTTISRHLERMGMSDNPGLWNAVAENTMILVNKLNRNLQDELAIVPLEAPKSNKPALDSATEKRLASFKESITILMQKKYSLPEEFHRHLDGLCAATEKIISHMRDDPSDMISGSKFLTRYLPSTHLVLDEYIRLSQNTTSNQEINDALARSINTVARLEDAFEHEYAGLLQNDALSFNTELNVLDKLLKMDGHGGV